MGWSTIVPYHPPPLHGGPSQLEAGAIRADALALGPGVLLACCVHSKRERVHTMQDISSSDLYLPFGVNSGRSEGLTGLHSSRDVD